jgi:hypothetical protein
VDDVIDVVVVITAVDGVVMLLLDAAPADANFSKTAFSFRPRPDVPLPNAEGFLLAAVPWLIGVLNELCDCCGCDVFNARFGVVKLLVAAFVGSAIKMFMTIEIK